MNPPTATEPQSIPPKIQSAMDYLRYAHHVTGGGESYGESWSKAGGRELSVSEAKVYEAALRVLLEYFNDRTMDYTGSPRSKPGGDGPNELVPVNP